MNAQAHINKNLRQKRNMRFFIEAAKEIIDKEGVSKASIRSVAAKAGYNSATLYQYFDSFDHLLVFVAISSFRDFILEFSQSFDSCSNYLEKHFLAWYCFCDQALKMPELFSVAFFYISENVESFNELIDQFYEIFPQEENTIPENVKPFLVESNYNTTSRQTLERCVYEGYITESQIDEINDFRDLMLEGFLHRAPKQPEKYSTAYFMEYLRKLFLSYNPALAGILNKMDFAGGAFHISS